MPPGNHVDVQGLYMTGHAPHGELTLCLIQAAHGAGPGGWGQPKGMSVEELTHHLSAVEWHR